jgi:HEAT repeat protein
VLGLLGHPREDMRAQAARTAWSIGLDAAHGPALLAHVDSPDDYVREFAAWAAGQIGAAGNEAIPSLLAMLAREEGHAAGTAAVTLRRLAPDNPVIVESLVRSLRGDDGVQKVQAARGLGKLGPVAAAAAPALLHALEDAREDVRAESVIALGRVAGADAVSPLLTRLQTDSPWVREEAARALGRLGPPARRAIPDLIQALRNDPAPVRRQAARALGRMGGDGATVIPALKAAVADDDQAVRDEVETALAALGAP